MRELDASRFLAQRRGWATLRSLRPQAIDLRRIALIRDCSVATLSDVGTVETLLLQLGLNDEGLDELPTFLHEHCGGLRIWQYPVQFAPYLVFLSELRVRSYVELGVRHGGSFIATTEYLGRFLPLDFAVGVDILEAPSVAQYTTLNPAAQWWCVDSGSDEFMGRLNALGTIDLVFIDSHHEEAQCRREVHLLIDRANMLALHDITNVGCPGVGKVWRELKSSGDYACFEFTDQYAGLGPFMGIGLAVKKTWLLSSERG